MDGHVNTCLFSFWANSAVLQFVDIIADPVRTIIKNQRQGESGSEGETGTQTDRKNWTFEHQTHGKNTQNERKSAKNKAPVL